MTFSSSSTFGSIHFILRPMTTKLCLSLLSLLIFLANAQNSNSNDVKDQITVTLQNNNSTKAVKNLTAPLTIKIPSNATNLTKPFKLGYHDNAKITSKDNQKGDEPRKFKAKTKEATSVRQSLIQSALQTAAKQGIDAMVKLYEMTEPDILRKGQFLDPEHPATFLSKFSAPAEGTENNAKAAFATLIATKSFRMSLSQQTLDHGRQASDQKLSFRRTSLEGFCPPREAPICLPAAQRYRTHDGTCNNPRRPRWGSAQMPYNRYLPPDYEDNIDVIRRSVSGNPLSSPRFVSLLVHGAKDVDSVVTLMLAQWGQFIDHDLTSTAQPRSINGSVPKCCGTEEQHPSCLPIKVPMDDPWLAPLNVRCLEFLRSAPAQRRDCLLSWREQTNQATSFLDASPIYSNNARTSDNARVFQKGLLQYGRGNPFDDVCLRGALHHNCIRPGDPRSGEQPGLLAMHHVWVGEHNRIASELSQINEHWSDEKLYQETRRIIGAMFQHITYREFLPLILGREVCRLFDLELLQSGYYTGYNPFINPTIANSFAASAFRFGHSLIQSTYLRCDRNHNFLDNNVNLHQEFSRGDIGGAGSLHRLLRGLAAQHSQKRDEFITPELTNHLFQSENFPFGLDLAAINIQRGRDHGIPAYTSWREPCGLSPIRSWEDLEPIVGVETVNRLQHAYTSVDDIDLYVAGLAERPVVGGLLGPTFACIIAQQFSNLRKGDRFWYENPGFESSFTPAQLHSIRRVSLAQVICRAVGGGTLQPHIFLPHDSPGNERVVCGTGPLAPIDVFPWAELDPFIDESANTASRQPLQVNNNTVDSNDIQDTPQINNLDLTPNGFTGVHLPERSNFTKVHDKLDFKHKILRPSTNPDRIINNKVETKRKKHSNTRQTLDTTTKRTIVINNIPLILERNVDNLPKRKNDINKKTNVSSKTQQNTHVRNNTKKILKTNKSTSSLNLTNEVLQGRNEDKKDTPTEKCTDSSNQTIKVREDKTDKKISGKENTTDTLNVTHKQHKLSTDKNGNKTETSTIATLSRIGTTKPQRQNTEKHNSITETIPETLDTTNQVQTLKKDKKDTRMTRSTNSLNITDKIQILSPTNTEQPLHQNATDQLELRQYNHDLNYGPYKRPQPVVIDAPNMPQYQIEINIKPSANKNKYSHKQENFDTKYDAYDRYDTYHTLNDYNSASTPFSYRPGRPQRPYYDRPSDYAQTKPPTIIYVDDKNDHDRYQNSQPGILQNILSLGANTANNFLNHFQRPFGVTPSGGSSSSSSSSASAFGAASSSSSSSSGGSSASSSASSSGHFGSVSGSVSTSNGDSAFSFKIEPPLQTNYYSSLGSTPPNRYSLISSKDPFSNSPFSPSDHPPVNAYPRPSSPYSSSTLPPPPPPFHSPFSEYNRRTTTTRRSFYIRPNTDNYLYKELPKSNNDKAKPKSNTDDIESLDYEITTYHPLTRDNTTDFDYYSDYDSDEESVNEKFDKDGYLRPELMSLDLLTQAFDTNSTSTNSSNVNDDFVLPILAITNTTLNLPTDQNVTFTDIAPRHPTSDILAEDEAPRFDIPPITRKPTKNAEPIAYAPLNVLTKPERPDKWLIFEAPLETPLPDPPEIITDSPMSKELPKPMHNFHTSIRKRIQVPSAPTEKTENRP